MYCNELLTEIEEILFIILCLSQPASLPSLLMNSHVNVIFSDVAGLERRMLVVKGYQGMRSEIQHFLLKGTISKNTIS